MAAPATNQAIQSEAADMTPQQKVEAATQLANAITPLMKEGGPLIAMALQTFMQTIQAAPAMMAPALGILLALPLPQPMKDSILAIMQQAMKSAPGPAPGAPAPPSSQAVANAKSAAKPFPWIPVVAGVFGIGLIAFFVSQRKPKRRRRRRR